MIESYAQARSILANLKDYTSRRTDQQMRPFEIEGRIYPKVRTFHQAWLMYIDGDEHKHLRQMVLNVLFAIPSDLHDEALTLLRRGCEAGVIDMTTVETVALAWHRQLLGLSLAQQAEALHMAEPILAFFFFDEVPPAGLTALEDMIDKMHDWFEGESFPNSSVMQLMQESHVPAGTRLNVIIDSLEPVKAALSVLFHQMAERAVEGLASTDIVHEVMRLFPPFRFINRVATCPVEGGEDLERVSIDLYKVNRDPEKFHAGETFAACKHSRHHMAFGYGRHSCPGAQSSLSLLGEVASLLQSYNLTLLEGAIEIERGFCRANADLKIRVDPRGI